MNIKDISFKTIIWRFAPLVISLIWLVCYILQFYPLGIHSTQYMLLSPKYLYIPFTIIILVAFSTIFFPYKFLNYGILCWLFGLVWLIDGGFITALLIHLLGYVYLYRQKFFVKGKTIKLLIGFLIIIAAIASQARIADIDMIPRILNFSGCMAVIILIYGILQPEIQIIKIHNEEMTHKLPQGFTEQDAEILNKILSGVKYDAIANDEKMAVSTFKKYVHRLFISLQVNDRTDFLVRYAKHHFILTDENPGLTMSR